MPTKKTVEEPVEVPVEAVPKERGVIEQLLALEAATKAAASEYPSGDNSDAMKSALSNAAHGIAHIRKVLDANAAVAR